MQISTVKIRSIRKIQNNSKRYDIETKHTHNFFANNILIHNSCMTLYNFKDQWRAQTLGMIDAEGSVGTLPFSFSHMFWTMFGTEVNLDPTKCYMLEMANNLNRVVTKYDSDQLVLTGIRNLITLQEEVPTLAGMPSLVRLPETFKADSVEDVVKMANSLTDLSEGFVVVDGTFNRVKIKSPLYFAISKIKESAIASVGYLIESALSNEGAEVLVYFEEFTAEFARIDKLLTDEIARLDQKFAAYKKIKSDKEFALTILPDRFQGLLFQMRRGNIKTFRQGMIDFRGGGKKIAQIMKIKSELVYEQS